jgi:FixJ family two-component response regulator
MTQRLRLSPVAERASHGSDLASCRIMRRILVVDGERNARGALRELLEEEGYEVALCGTAVEALAKTAELQPAVALVDARQPGELHHKLNASGCAVILMSVFRDDAVAGVPFLRKPLELDQLFAAVAAAFAHPARAAARS